MAEDRLRIEAVTDKVGNLLLSEEDWVAKYRHCLMPESSSSGGNGKKPWKPKNGGGGGRADRGDRGDKKEPVVNLTSMGTPRRKWRCRNCGIYGHWAEDCKKPKKERKEEAHYAQADVDHPSILLATVNAVHVHARDVELERGCATRHAVHLNEKKVHPADGDQDHDDWVLDTGASNHMTGRREALASLDTTVRGTVWFGDGSLVEIEGIGSVMLQSKAQGHKVLIEVYYIPKLKSNIVSLGQLEEGGCKVVIEDGFCNVYDVERAPVCLVAKADDMAWV
jgi:hypothetical protein